MASLTPKEHLSVLKIFFLVTIGGWIGIGEDETGSPARRLLNCSLGQRC